MLWMQCYEYTDVNVVLWMQCYVYTDVNVVLWMQCYVYTDVTVVLWMLDGNDDLTGDKKFTREQKVEDGKGINLSGVNVGERDTK